MKLATVEDIVYEAYRLLGDVEDVVGSARRLGYGSTDEQASTLTDVRYYLSHVKTVLRRMENDAAMETCRDVLEPACTDEQTVTLASIGHHISDVRVALRRIAGFPPAPPSLRYEMTSSSTADRNAERTGAPPARSSRKPRAFRP